MGVVLARTGKSIVLGEKMDLGGQGGTVRKLGVSSTRRDRESSLVPVYNDKILIFLGKKGARGIIFFLRPD